MAIIFDEKSKIFNLKTKTSSYIFKILCDKVLMHIHYGKRIENTENMDYLYRDFTHASFASFDKDLTFNNHRFSTDSLEQEYSFFGSCDLRTPAFHAQYKDGSTVTKAYYKSHKIYNGKPKLCDLPATYAEDDSEVQTLEITLFDALTNMSIILYYSVFEEFDAITRSVKVINGGKDDINLKSVLSFSVDFPNDDFDFTHLYGSWARERYIEKRPVAHANLSIDSKRGSSSHYHNPFFALSSKNADEFAGDVYGFSLVYSGNFIGGVECDTTNIARVYMGINPFNFNWLLKEGESFQTPEAVMVYSDCGFSKMSNIYHTLYRKRLCRGEYRDKVRPVLANNWEATVFDFDEDKLLRIAENAKKIGVDLFVLDDGWFGKRNNDNCSLGDWVTNTKKIPSGMGGLAKKINDLGMEFGLWFEPEMVSPDSDLYRAHPDWCIHVKNRDRSEARNQLVLDLSRKDVCDYIVNTLSDVLSNANITYVKWDMNRNITEPGSELLSPERQMEIYHRYILGLYNILERLTTKFPHVLWEGCSGGGGRFDPALLYYFPQSWASDNTDACDRIFIQYGTSLVMPCSSMGSHVTSAPKSNGRITPLKTRGNVAMTGQFGYELDLSKCSEEEIEEMKEQIVFYKKYRHVIQNGDMYRLRSPYTMKNCALEFISEDKNTVMVFYFTLHRFANDFSTRLTLHGLDKTAVYKEVNSNLLYGGDMLLNAGIKVHDQKDFDSFVFIFEKQ